MNGKRIVVIGGVAGGAACASRCRRLDENARIVIIDRGPYVSFANCGLPYYVGDVITDESKLLVANAALYFKTGLILKSAPSMKLSQSTVLRGRSK